MVLISTVRRKKGSKMKIYTATGDKGITSLFSGERIEKSHIRVEAYGDVDELNAVLGAFVAALTAEQEECTDTIERIQSDLFHVGALLATTPDSSSVESLTPFSGETIEFLEDDIDRIEEKLPPSEGFLLPGGHISAAWAHVARTVCRRAERHAVRLVADLDDTAPHEQYRTAIIYLNRLSDYLFVLARYCNHVMSIPDSPWRK